MDSQFKKYRTAIGGDPDAFDPSRILSAAMMPPSPMMPESYGPGPQETAGYQPPQPQPSFDVDKRLPKPRSVQPQIDMGMARGEEMDTAKRKKAEGLQASLAGFASGLSAGVNSHGNFGQGFATALGRAVDVTQGSMQKNEERRQVEEARNLEIEQMFFNRSVKLQELAQRRRESEQEIADDLEDRRLRREAATLAERRADQGDRRIELLEEQNERQGRVAQQNADANTVRAGAARTRANAGAAKTQPRTASQVDAYARKRVYIQFGAADEQGNIVDEDKKKTIDRQLQSTAGRRKTRVQEFYDKARQEATKTTVDPSSEDDSE